MHLNQQVILSLVILSSFSRGTNLFASEITKIASRYGFASGVSWPLRVVVKAIAEILPGLLASQVYIHNTMEKVKL